MLRLDLNPKNEIGHDGKLWKMHEKITIVAALCLFLMSDLIPNEWIVKNFPANPANPPIVKQLI
tara:strand:+ start:60 stop:251 length:192 start_codon:yes stop_codon:yes gene_type:complete